MPGEARATVFGSFRRVSLMELLEAVDWYNQRDAACKNPELKVILEHNRDWQFDHAAMVLEWIRRNDGRFSHALNDYILTTKSLKSHAHGD